MLNCFVSSTNTMKPKSFLYFSFLLVAVFGAFGDVANAYYNAPYNTGAFGDVANAYYYVPYKTGEPGPQYPQEFPKYRSWRSTDQSKGLFPTDFSSQPRPLESDWQQTFNRQPAHDPGQQFQPVSAEKSNGVGLNSNQQHSDYREIQNQEKATIGQPIQSAQPAFRSNPSLSNQGYELGSHEQPNFPSQVKIPGNLGISGTDIAKESKEFDLKKNQQPPKNTTEQNPEHNTPDQPIQSSRVTFHSSTKDTSLLNQDYELGLPQQLSFRRQIRDPSNYRKSSEESNTADFNLNQQPSEYPEYQNPGYRMIEQAIPSSPVLFRSHTSQPSYLNQDYVSYPYEQPRFHGQINYPDYYRTSPKAAIAQDSESTGFNLHQHPPNYPENQNPEYDMTGQPIQPSPNLFRSYTSQPNFPNQGYELYPYEQPTFRKHQYLDYYRTSPEAFTAQDSETDGFNSNQQPPYYPENHNIEYSMIGQPIQSSPATFRSYMSQPSFQNQGYELYPYEQPRFLNQIQDPDYYRRSPEASIAQNSETTGSNLNQEPSNYTENQTEEYSMNGQPNPLSSPSSPAKFRSYMSQPSFSYQGYELHPHKQSRFRRQMMYPDYYKISRETTMAEDSGTTGLNLNQQPRYYPANQQPHGYPKNQQLPNHPENQQLPDHPEDQQLPDHPENQQPHDYPKNQHPHDYPENQQLPEYPENQQPPDYPGNQNPESGITGQPIQSSPLVFHSYMNQPSFPNQGYELNPREQPSFHRHSDNYRASPEAYIAKDSETTGFNLNQQPLYYPENQQPPDYPENQQPHDYQENQQPHGYPENQQLPDYPENQQPPDYPESGMTGQPIQSSPFVFHSYRNQPSFPNQGYELNPHELPGFHRHSDYYRASPEAYIAKNSDTTGFNLNHLPPYYPENQNLDSSINGLHYLHFPNHGNEVYPEQPSFHTHNINSDYAYRNAQFPDSRSFVPTEQDSYGALPYRRALMTDGSVLKDPNPLPFPRQIVEKAVQRNFDQGIEAPYFSARLEKPLSIRQSRNTNFPNSNQFLKRNFSDAYIGNNQQRDSEKHLAEVKVLQKRNILEPPLDAKLLPGLKQSLRQRSVDNQLSGSDITDVLTQHAKSMDGSYYQIPNVYNDKIDYPKQQKSLNGQGQLKHVSESDGLVEQPPPETYQQSRFLDKFGEYRVIDQPKIGHENPRYPYETRPSESSGYQDFTYGQEKQNQSAPIEKSGRELNHSSVSNQPRQTENPRPGYPIGSAHFGQRKQFENPSTNENASVATGLTFDKKDDPEEHLNPMKENVQNATELVSFRKNNSEEHAVATSEKASVVTELISIKKENSEEHFNPTEENNKNATELTSFRKNDFQRHSNATKENAWVASELTSVKNDYPEEHLNPMKEIVNTAERNSIKKEDPQTESGQTKQNAANTTDSNPIKDYNSGTKSEPAKENAEVGRDLISTMNNESRPHLNRTGENAEVGRDLMSAVNNGSEMHSKPTTENPAVTKVGNSTKMDDSERYSKSTTGFKVKGLKEYMTSIARKRFGFDSDEEQ